MRDHFKILKVDLSAGKAEVIRLEGRNEVAGGSGLAAVVFNRYGYFSRPWNHPEQPLIFAIGPLTGYFPLMSKTVCAFKSPYHDQYTESHAGGRSALSLAFAGIDALVITGRSREPCCLAVGSRNLEIRPAGFLWGLDVIRSGKILRNMFKTSSGHRSILRIGQAGEKQLAMAGINADTYRHFGRLGGGAVMGAKNLKAVVINGDGVLDQPDSRGYADLYKRVFKQVIDTGMMKKYHDLGTPANIMTLNSLQALPWRNLQASSDPGAEGISGERFAKDALLRNIACAGCPVGCIHVGFVREKFMKDNRYMYKQVAYDYEPIFAAGSMLGVSDCFSVLNIMDVMERVGLDVISGGVAIAWATEAFERGLIGPEETIIPLGFGNVDACKKAAFYLGTAANDFYRLLGQGTLKAAERYGGSEFACVLGQEMAGYATGELFFAAQSLGFRHSHLDSGAYSFEQKHAEKDVEKMVDFLMEDEVPRAFLTSMVACLFARGVYRPEVLSECLNVLGYEKLSMNVEQTAHKIRSLRWKTRFACGFDPDSITIPKRFYKVKSWKGPVDPAYLNALRSRYAERLKALADESQTP